VAFENTEARTAFDVPKPEKNRRLQIQRKLTGQNGTITEIEIIRLF
jgi:hypothetical protein